MKLKAALALIICALVSPSQAGMIHRGGGTMGSAQINIGSDLLPVNFLNILQTGSMSFSGGATPGTAALDTNGYPTQSFTGTVNVTFPNPFWAGVTYTFSWTSGTKLQITALGVNTGCSLSGVGGAVNACGG